MGNKPNRQIQTFAKNEYKFIGDNKRNNKFTQEMRIFKEQMKTWKKNFCCKKAEIGKMERKQLKENREYQGERKDGKAEGSGILFCVGGEYHRDRYEGEFHDNEYHGKGTLNLANGTKIQANFESGRLNGKGICYSPNDNKYEGNQKDNKTSGQGIIYYSSDRQKESGRTTNLLERYFIVMRIEEGRNEVLIYVGNVFNQKLQIFMNFIYYFMKLQMIIMALNKKRGGICSEYLQQKSKKFIMMLKQVSTKKQIKQISLTDYVLKVATISSL